MIECGCFYPRECSSYACTHPSQAYLCLYSLRVLIMPVVRSTDTGTCATSVEWLAL